MKIMHLNDQHNRMQQALDIIRDTVMPLLLPVADLAEFKYIEDIYSKLEDDVVSDLRLCIKECEERFDQEVEGSRHGVFGNFRKPRVL